MSARSPTGGISRTQPQPPPEQSAWRDDNEAEALIDAIKGTERSVIDGATLRYKGDGDYDVTAGPLVIELSYECASDYMLGDWWMWAVRVGKQRFGTHSLLGPGEFTDWLEDQARASGHLPDEPDTQS